MTVDRTTAGDVRPQHDQPVADGPRNADTLERQISIGERLRSPQTLISFGVALGLIYFIFRQLNI